MDKPPPVPGVRPPLPPRTKPPIVPVDARPPSLWRQAATERGTDVDKPDEVGFGGWLTYVVVTLSLALLNLVESLWRVGGIYLDPRRWSRLTNPSSSAYDPSWPILIRYLVWGGSALLVLDAFVLGLMIARRKAFRISAMVFYGAAFAYLIGEYLLAGNIPAIGDRFDAQTAKTIFFKLAATIFGLIYLANSHRVRNTFVK